MVGMLWKWLVPTFMVAGIASSAPVRADELFRHRAKRRWQEFISKDIFEFVPVSESVEKN